MSNNNQSNPDAVFEQAMIDVANATDGKGRRVILFRGAPTAANLRAATREFASAITSTSVLFIDTGEDGQIQESQSAEIAAWTNLALLARATAAALKAGR